MRADHMDPQHRPARGVGHDLHEPGLADDVGLADRAEVELLDRDLPAFVSRLSLAEAHRGDLGRAVRNPRDVHVIDLGHVDPGDALGDGVPLGERDVRQLKRRRGNVTDRPDVLDVRTKIPVDGDEALLMDGDPRVLQG